MLNERIRRRLERFVAGALISALGLTALTYAADYAVFRYRVGTGQAFGQVTVTSYDAVPQKSGKTVFIFNDPQAQTCVNSLFPRAGYLPCWYLQRHTEQRTNF